MLSASDTELTRNLYAGVAGYEIHEIGASQTMGGRGATRGKTKELLITNEHCRRPE